MDDEILRLYTNSLASPVLVSISFDLDGNWDNQSYSWCIVTNDYKGIEFGHEPLLQRLKNIILL